MSGPGTPPLERIKSGIVMLEYLQAHWGSLSRILNAVQECPAAFGATVGGDVFTSVADFAEEDGYQYFDTTKGGLIAADLRDIADELDRRNAEWDAKVRGELGSPPMRKFRGEAYAATCYGTAPVEFEFEVPATATVEEIESAANMAAMDEVQVSWSEVHPPKPRKKKVKTD